MNSKNQKTEKEFKSIDLSLLKRLLVYLKPYKKSVFFALSLAVMSSILSPVRPFLTKMAIDKYIVNSNLNGLLIYIGLLFGILIINAAVLFGVAYLMQWVGQKILYDMRVKLFRHIHNLSFKFYDNNPVGKLVTRVTNDIEALNEMFSSGVVMIIADILLIVFIVSFMLIINWKLALLTLCVLPFILIATNVFRKKVRVVFRDIRLSISKMNSFINEAISGMSTVKVFEKEEIINHRFKKLNYENKDLWVKTIFYHAVFFPVIEFLSSLALALVIWYTGYNIISGAMTIGTLVAFLQYAEMFFRPIRDLTEKYTTLQSAMASSERIFELMDQTDAIELNAENPIQFQFKNKIEFHNVNFSYDESKTVLKNVDFEVKKGETIAIVGATGSGKTTIISLISGFYDLSQGDILIDGTSIKNIDKNELREKIALVMQDVFIFSGTIKDNITLGNGNYSHEDILKVSRELGAYDFIKDYPGEFDFVLSERGQSLSSGQRQLISFCRAYLKNPEILILDEATSSIDSQTEAVIEKSLDKLLHKRTSIIIAHRLSTIKRADKIIVLHHGVIKETGTHQELLDKGGIYSKLYNLQFRQ